MKKVIYVFVFIALSMNVFAQNPITPNGREVYATTKDPLTQPQIDEINDRIDSNYSFVETIQAPEPYFGLFDCHFFAWHNNQGYTKWSGTWDIWKNGTPPEYKWFENPADYFSDENYSIPTGYASYIPTTDDDASIVVYKDQYGYIKHSARRLVGTSDLISKWGQWGVYRHAPTEVPLTYGSTAEKYKINPQYRPVGSGDPGGRSWGSINNALIGITSGSAITALSGSSTSLNYSDANIPSGVTLTIKSNSNENLNNHSIISSGGTIIKEAGATISGLRATLTRNSVLKGLCGTVQVAVNAVTNNDYGNQYTLEMSSGSFSENVNISNKFNLLFYGSGSTTINGTISVSSCESCTFNNFTASAFSLNNCTNPLLGSINLNIGSVNPSLYAYNCTNLYFTGGNISDRYAYTNQTGFNFYQSSTSTIDGSTYTLIYANVKGVYANASSVDVNYATFCNNTYDLVTSGGASIDATYCYFPGGTASTQGSGINLYYNQNANCSGLPKRNGSLTNSSTKEAEILSDEFKQIDRNNFDIAKRVRADISENKGFNKDKYRDEYLNVLNEYREFIDKYPESDYSKTALISSVHIYRTLDDYEGMKVFLQNIISDNSLAKENGWAKRFMIDYYCHNKDFTTALNMAEEIIKEYPDNDDLVCNVLFVEGNMYLHDLNNNEAAIACFSDIVDKYLDNDVATFAVNELKLLGIEKEKKDISASEQEVVGFSTSSFPNPFNPSTTIEYNLPVDTKVVIKVYDMLGREVSTLVNENKTASRHIVQFNASSLSSGVYFYSINADGYYQVKKLLLVK